MTTQIVSHTGPEPVTLEEAKNHLRVDFGADDVLIQGVIEAARTHAESYTNLIVRSANVRVSFDSYQSWYFLNGPVVSITSVALTDEDGGVTTVPSDEYFLNRDSLPAKLFVKHQPGKPVVFVTINYAAGFTDTLLPSSIKSAILHLVADWYENRDDPARRFPTVARRLLDIERRQYIA